jgi:hypothetical protein
MPEQDEDLSPLTQEEEENLGPSAVPVTDLESGLSDDFDFSEDQEEDEAPQQVVKEKRILKRHRKINKSPEQNQMAVAQGDSQDKGSGVLEEGAVLPNVIIREENSKSRRYKRAVALGLSELILPPITRNRIAVYQYTGGKPDNYIDPSTKQKPEPKDASLPGTYILYDKFEPDLVKKNKLMRNLGRPQIEKDERGKDKIVDTIVDLEFVAGFLRIDCIKEYRKYVFTELHPLNGSNRHRENGNEVKFKRVDIKNNKDDAFLIAERELAYDAEGVIRKMVKKDEIVTIAVAMGVYQEGLDVSSLRDSTIIAARKNPKRFFSLRKDVRPAIRLNVIDGLGLGLIEYTPDFKTFIDAEDGKKIHTHLTQDDPIDSIVNFFATEGAHHYEKLKATIEYWED